MESSPNSPPSLAESLARYLEVSDYTAERANGGHMAYQRLFMSAPELPLLFAKGHDSSLFTDAEREDHAKAYLKKEHMVFEYLQSQDFQFVPEYTRLVDDRILVMEAYSSESGWYWRLPYDEKTRTTYVEDILTSLTALQEVSIPRPDLFFPKRIMKVYMEEGWDSFDGSTAMRLWDNLSRWTDQLRPDTRDDAIQMLKSINAIRHIGRSLYDDPQQLYLSHHDARQANITWHPDQGAKLIDWSWADVGFEKADTTMFLIDLAKSGYDVSPYLDEHFNPQHAILLLGHWLGRSLVPTKDSDSKVRFHQFASAASAYSLIEPGLTKL